MTMIAPGPLREVEKALDEIVNPALEIGAVGNSVSVRAKDQADVNRATALVRRALTDRTDIVIASQPDQSLLISLASGAHIVPPRPPLQPGQMLSTIKTRLNRLNLQATQIASIDNDHARVQLATADDAAIFRTALSRPSGFTIRLVDDANDNAATPPSPGDEKLQLPTKEYIWVSPRTIVTGDMIADAKVGISKFTESSIVTFHLTEEGRQRFGAATLENVGRRFVISVDGVAVEAPVIRDAILGGEGEISGGFTTEQAANLAQSMREHKDDLPLRAVDSDEQCAADDVGQFAGVVDRLGRHGPSEWARWDAATRVARWRTGPARHVSAARGLVVSLSDFGVRGILLQSGPVEDPRLFPLSRSSPAQPGSMFLVRLSIFADQGR